MLYKELLAFPIFELFGSDHKLDQLVFNNVKISINCQQRFWAPSLILVLIIHEGDLLGGKMVLT